MKRTMFLVLAVLTGSASFVAAAEPQCVGVTAGSAAQRGRPATPVFSATQVVDVDLDVLFSPAAALRLTGHHVVEVRIYSPKGNLYQSISVPFSFDRTNRPRERRLDDYPEPVALRTPVARTYNRSRHYGVAVTLPVAGTPILNNSLYGLWTATAFIDGARSACGAPMKFRITQ
jgi:hypothetical protein